MLKKIEKLRKKPKHIKDRYAFWIALSCTMSIALVWLVSIPSRFDNTPELSEKSSEQVSNFARMWGQMRSNLTASISDIRNQAQSPEGQPATTTQETDASAFFTPSSTPHTTDGNTVLIGTSSRKTDVPDTE